MTTEQRGYGEITGPPIGEMSRRRFMRRMLGVGVGLLSLEFLGGTLNFLWTNVRGGLGGKITLGTAADFVSSNPDWVRGLPYAYQPARIFMINVPAAKALVDATGQETPDPGAEVLALYRKCPHLGCQIPQLCDASKWFECLCHGSKYTILGEKRDGPAPRGMDSFGVELVDGAYVVDTSSKIDGPPIGTENFDPRTPDQMGHCAA